MRMELYAVKDNLAQEYGPVFEAKNENTAKRAVVAMMLKSEINVNEYSLYYLGYTEKETGEVYGGHEPVLVDFSDALGDIKLKLVEEK